jgi:cytochrome c oxidase subunit 2
MNRTELQSALDAGAGSSAALLERLGTVLYLGAGIVFAVVMGLVLYATFAGARSIRTRPWIVGGGLIFPAVTLSVLLVYSLAITNSIAALDTASMPRIHVTGKQWWWEVRYEAPEGGAPIVLANELHVPVGQPVEVLLHSTDVIHSFWAPSLAGKVDMIPGRTNRLVIRTDQAGVYRGQCAEYCGGQHALMAFHIVAEPQAQFEEWLAQQARPVKAPDDPFLREGYEAFFRGECQECHAIRGTSATAQKGPDLTHVGSRRALAAGVLDNHIGTMAGWIAGSQEVKAGNLMPSADVYSGRELRALSAWLGSLE